MLAVSASELASIQADVVSAVCDKTCFIYKITGEASDGYGTQHPTYASTPIVTVAGLSEPSGTQLQNFDYLLASLKVWQVKLPVGTNVDQHDHLVIDGVTLNAEVLLEPRSYQALLIVLASEVDDG